MLVMQNGHLEESASIGKGKSHTPISGGRIAPLIVLLLLLVPALLPLLHTASLPCTHDNALHYYRMTAMREAMRQGWFFSRWIPNLALGYGYPFFNFREPLPYMLGAWLYALGIPLPLVLGGLYAISLGAATWGAYTLGHALWGERAGWVAGIAYGLGPYVLLDTLRRGNMPESVALALLPWLLLVFRTLIRGEAVPRLGRRGTFVLAVALLVALFLSHNISSLLFAPFLGGYTVLLAWVYRERKAWPWAFGAALLAVALTAWFWMPALLEQDTVQLHLSRTTRNNDFHYNFVTWAEMLLHTPAPYDADFLNPPMYVPLGIVQVVLALVGVLRGLWRLGVLPLHEFEVELSEDTHIPLLERRVVLVFFVLVALAYLWMSTAASVRVWEAVPLLAFVQFPWRLVGRALLPIALLAGMSVADLSFLASRNAPEETRRTLWHGGALGCVLLLTLFSWPNTYPPKGMCTMSPYPTLRDVYAFELSGWPGVDPEGSYFPVWVEAHPTQTQLAEAFTRGKEPARLDPVALPEGARVVEASYKPVRASVVVDSPEAFRARWLGFYYPGWRVWVDDALVDVVPEPDTGLLTFRIPSGRHAARVRFGPTPLRALATVISALGVVTLALLLVVRAYPHPSWMISLRGLRAAGLQVGGRDIRDPKLAIWLLGSALVLLLLKLALVDRLSNPMRHSRLGDDDLPEVAHVLDQPFEGGLALLGYEIAQPSVPSDGEVQVDLLWQARAHPAQEYRTSVVLIGEDGQRWSEDGTLRPRGYEPTPPTTMWQPGQYAYDPHIVLPLPGTPPGSYTLVTALFDKDTLAPQSVLSPDGNPRGPDLTLGMITLTRPQIPPDLPSLNVPKDVESPARCDALALWHMSVDRVSAAPGEIIGVRWVWEAIESPLRAVTATLTLVGEDGPVPERVWPLPPVATWWPTDQWQKGERWIGRHVVRLPGGLTSGEYTLLVSLPDCVPLAEVSLDVNAPERNWTVPEDAQPVNVVFGERVRLAGYALHIVEGENVLRVRLVWQALDELDTSYRVFVHMLGDDGHVLGQSDGEPVNWTRPTTGWAVGEVVVETRDIALPEESGAAGPYDIWVGLYYPKGPRLSLPDGSDAWHLETVQQ